MDSMTALYTRKHYDLLPQGFPAQLVEGRLVRDASPMFGHQRVGFAVAGRLGRLVGARRMAVAPLDVHIDEFNVYQPDVVVFRHPVADDAAWADVPPPLLVVEVLSPSTAARDCDVKRVRYLDAGVDEVWIVDRLNRTIEVYDRGRYADLPRRVAGDTPVASKVLPGFALTPSALFSR